MAEWRLNKIAHQAPSQDVAYWPLADILAALSNVRFRG
jgi:hypothetical protein